VLANATFMKDFIIPPLTHKSLASIKATDVPSRLMRERLGKLIVKRNIVFSDYVIESDDFAFLLLGCSGS
jgi:hypothetical protein